MDQGEHERWNAYNYPGTRQLCCQCDQQTDRCEEDAIYTEDGIGPLCLDCWHETDEYKNSCIQEICKMVCIKAWSNAEPWRGPRYIDLALDCFDFHKTFGMWIKSEGELYFFLNHFTLYQG